MEISGEEIVEQTSSVDNVTVKKMLGAENSHPEAEKGLTNEMSE